MKFRLIIDKERCKGCGLCLEVCKREVLHMSRELNSKGQQYATSEDDQLCIGCRQCTDICPDAAIEILKLPEDDDRGHHEEGAPPDALPRETPS